MEQGYLRKILSRRQLQGFVRAPLDCNSHPLFLWQKRASAAKGIQRRSNVPSPVRYSSRRAVWAMATSLALLCCLSKTRCARTVAFSCGARSAFKLMEQGYLRKILSRRQLQGFVRAPLDCNSHPLFLWQKRASAATGIQRRSNVPSPVRYSYRRAVWAMATSLALLCCLSKTRCARTVAFSCGARSAFKLKAKGYLRKMLSRRQLQGFVILPFDLIIQPAPAFGGSEQLSSSPCLIHLPRGKITMAFSCGARSAFKLSGKSLLEKHATAPSAARLCSARLDLEESSLMITKLHRADHRQTSNQHKLKWPTKRRLANAAERTTRKRM